jgi:hypothetical protein
VDEPKKAMTEVDFYQQYVGQKCAFLCCRYQYRGILSSLVTNAQGELVAFVLANAVSVEVTGAAASTKATTEDAINNSILIKNDAIETFYQPNWCFAPLPGEDGWE